jgi:hypothetical protein
MSAGRVLNYIFLYPAPGKSSWGGFFYAGGNPMKRRNTFGCLYVTIELIVFAIVLLIIMGKL